MSSKIQTWLSIGLYSFILVFGIFSNILVIVFFAFKIKRHSTFRWFVVNLAIADGIVCIVTPLLRFYLIATNGYWHLGYFLCKMVTPIGFITVNISAWILCAIAYERYKAIGTPHKRPYTRRNINLICFIMWFVSFLMALPMFIWTDVQDGFCIPIWDRNQHLSVAIIALLFQSVFPIMIMALSYFMIQKAFTRQIHDMKSTISISTNLKDGNNNQNSMRIKSQMTTQTLLIAFVIFVICSLPYNIFYVVAVYMFRYGIYTREEMERYSPVYEEIEFWLSYLVVFNSIMNCVVYAGKFPTFRRFIILKVFFCKSHATDSARNHVDTTMLRGGGETMNHQNSSGFYHKRMIMKTTTTTTTIPTCPFDETLQKRGVECIPMEQRLLVDKKE